MAKVVCAWLRNDLRVHDSPVLHRAAMLASQKGLPVLPLYVFDPSHFKRTEHGTLKTGPIRALFLLQSVLALKKRLRQLGSDLLIRIGRPEEVISELLPRGSVILTQEEVTSEELRLDSRIRSAIGADVLWEYCWGATLFHKDDLPFRRGLKDMPDVYTSFKNQVEPELACKANEVPASFNDTPKHESQIKARPCLPVPDMGSLPLPMLDEGQISFEPSWSDLPYEQRVDMPRPNQGAVLDFEGGEHAGLERLQYYIQDKRLIATYFDTRNEMLGGDYSTKLAPWLANGCVSPRKVFEQLREFERAFAASKSTYWILFALGARDFFRFYAAKHGDAIFREGGVTGRKSKWHGGTKEFQLWANGQTGYPYVDANMRELLATGFMSNRGRQNVASFLILDLGVDWRRGADWFESLLVDYDVTANWCNWLFAAGLTGGRLNRFNVLRQAKNYDPDGAYVKHWVPELASVSTQFIHEPWLMSDLEHQRFSSSAYPPPCIDPSTFPSGAGPVPIQLKGRGRGTPKASLKHEGYGGGKGFKHRSDDTPQMRYGSDVSDEKKPDQTCSAPRRRWRGAATKETVSVDFAGPDWLRNS